MVIFHVPSSQKILLPNEVLYSLQMGTLFLPLRVLDFCPTLSLRVPPPTPGPGSRTITILHGQHYLPTKLPNSWHGNLLCGTSSTCFWSSYALYIREALSFPSAIFRYLDSVCTSYKSLEWICLCPLQAQTVGFKIRELSFQVIILRLIPLVVKNIPVPTLRLFFKTNKSLGTAGVLLEKHILMLFEWLAWERICILKTRTWRACFLSFSAYTHVHIIRYSGETTKALVDRIGRINHPLSLF